MSLKSWIPSVVVGAVLVLGLLVFAKPQSPPLGSVTGPDSSFECETHNGLQSCFAYSKMRQATTTVCALKSPSATSTIVGFADGGIGATFKVSSTTASVLTVATSTTAFATTSMLLRQPIAANAQLSVVSTTTPANGGIVLPPNTYLVFGMEGGVGTFSPVGTCSAAFRVL